MDMGEPVAVALPEPEVPAATEEPEASLTARWSRRWVTPDHNRRWPPATPPTDRIPGQAKVRMLVRTRNVPDGTSATITVHHCHTDAQVTDGRVDGLEVRRNRVVDPDTGQPPVFVFEAKHDPWDPWDRPFFYFKVEVQHQGLTGETPSDYQGQPRRVLRVRYWHAVVADRIADTPAGGNLSTRAEMREIGRILGRGRDHRVYRRAFNQNAVPVALWGSVLRNTYAYHHASHGDIVDRGTGAQLNQTVCPSCGTTYINGADPCPADGTATNDPNPPTVPVGNWRSVVVLGQTDLGDAEVNQANNVPSVPRYLVYMDTCVAGWEPSLGNAFIARGTQNYLAFRMYIPDRAARRMARLFYRKWKRTYRCDPNRIAQVYWDVGAAFYGSMRPILLGDGGGQIHQQQAMNDLEESMAGLVADLNEILN